jgi:hypothetical protein
MFVFIIPFAITLYFFNVIDISPSPNTDKLFFFIDALALMIVIASEKSQERVI